MLSLVIKAILTGDALQLAAVLHEHEGNAIELEATALDRRLRSWWRYCRRWRNVLIETSAASPTTTVWFVAVVVVIASATEATATRCI